MAPLHRQYKTARTETRRHLLLKIRQMPTQTSASRGYVLFRGVIRDTHKSPKIVCRLANSFRGVFQTWKDTDHRRCQARRGRNTRILLQRICCRPFYPELSGICFSEYSSSPILFRYGWRLRGRAGSDAASAGCAALRLARCMPPVMWESAGAASSASIKQARLMESSP